MSKNMNIALLYDLYRKMLTDKQANCIDLYYNEDLSLAEMSENLDITRQGARDNIKRAEKVLFETEEKLGLGKRFMDIKSRLDQIDVIIKEIEKSPNIVHLSDDIKRKINQILTIIMEMNENND